MVCSLWNNWFLLTPKISNSREVTSVSLTDTLKCALPLFQNSKVLAKKELAYVPIIGWMWYFVEMIFCTRKWEQDRQTVAKSLLHLRDYPENYLVRMHRGSVLCGSCGCHA